MGIAERKERERSQRYEAIIDAAEKVFFTRGFNIATMDDIAKESELGKGTLYLYFESKEDLHIAVAHRALDKLTSMSDIVLEKGGDALDKLTNLAYLFASFGRKYPGYMYSILYFEDIEFDKLSVDKEKLKDILLNKSVIKSVMSIVEQGIKEGHIRDDIPSAVIAHTLWLQVLGIFQLTLFHKSLFSLLDMDKESLLAHHLKLVFNGIRK